GTRAVDRVGDDYARLVGLSAPTLRPEISVDAIKKYGQNRVDVINLQTNGFESIAVTDLLGAEPLPGYENIFSLEEDGYLQIAYTSVPPKKYSHGVITFDKLLKDTTFPVMMREILSVIEDRYQCPIDIEFSHDATNFYLLQTRPSAQRILCEKVDIPENIPVSDLVFSVSHDVQDGRLDDIEYIIYCDPRAYKTMPDEHSRHQLARMVGKVNARLADKDYILMGPGRWGSNNINLGIPVQYSEINNAKALVEVAFKDGDYTPEVSFGTHFFLDLVERGIHYLPLFPDDAGNIFNTDFFDAPGNLLAAIVPGSEEFDPYLKIIDVALLSGGRPLQLRMNSEAGKALAYFADDK
ncbi:MAG: hypothetical protein KAU50_06780, partial [Candidatus Marinimicrobia bacterium]|nr:hypothetical protein [Candidatus Neomarinimicrobiota bacterium]